MRKQLFINGEWMAATEYTKLRSPYSNEVIAEIPLAKEEQVDQAIDAAYNSREIMAEMPAYQRAEILENLVKLLKENEKQAAEIIACESAKPLKYALAEVVRTIETYKFAAEEAKRIHGETIPMDAAVGGVGRIAYTTREPIGVVGAITPFNFPMNLVAHKVGPAIASGNTIVLKPASQTPLSAFYLAELLEQAGLPKGVLNVVTGSGRIVGDRIVSSEKVSMITFTGSPAVGIGIRNKAGLKKVTLELGSNAGVIIDKGIDIEKTAARCVVGAFSNQGQVCISLQRMYVHTDLYDAFVEAFKKESAKLVLGDPLDPFTDISALISPENTDRSLNWIQDSIADGGKLALGGSAKGTVLKPTILLDVKAHSSVSCQEVFAPIVMVNQISSVEEGIHHINDSKYGLQAGIYTNDIKTAFLATKKLHVGGVMVNDIPTYRVDQMPYGGVKESGTGREGLKYAVEEMTESKLVVWNNE